MEAVAIPGEVSDLSDVCLVDLLQMAPTADVLENLRDEDPERVFGAKAQAALLRCLRHPLVVEHPPGRPYRERLLKLAALAAERDGLAVDDGLAEAHAEALCEQRASDQWCHKTFVLDVEPPRNLLVGTSSAADPPAATPSPALITARVSPNLFEGGTGCHEWAAGFSLAELVASHGSRLFAGKRVVEIGPGVGVAATALAALTRPPLAALTLLDRDNETLTNLAANLAINGVPSRYALDDADTKRHRKIANEISQTNVRDGRGSADGEDRDLDAVSGVRRRRRASTPTTPSLARLDWHDFDPAALASIRADAVVAADVLYDPTNVPALLDVTAALLGRCAEKRTKEETLGGAPGVDAHSSGVSKEKNDAAIFDEPFALFVSAVRQPATLALFARLAAERGFEPEDVTETLGVAPGVGFRRLAEAQRAEIRVHALKPPKVLVESSVI